MISALYGETDVVKMLVDHGANLKARAENGVRSVSMGDLSKDR
jgi:hypothetical protein